MLFNHNSAHTGCQKKRVPEEGKIGRTYTIFNFLTYLLGARHPNYRGRKMTLRANIFVSKIDKHRCWSRPKLPKIAPNMIFRASVFLLHFRDRILFFDL